jgi:hypothetical protein
LVTKGFTGSGGHDNEGVTAFADAFNNRFLLAFESVKAKKLP